MEAGPRPTTGAAARLLDLSRLFSRVGRGAFTGVDRVEAAYLDRLLDRSEALFSVVRTPEGFSLMDRTGTAELASRLSGAQAWGRQDFKARLRRKASPAQRAARADLRRLALAHGTPRQLPELCRAHLPNGTVWLNVGHSNLGPEMFDAVRAVPGATTSILIHDVIPLDFPQFQRPGTVDAFAEKIRTVARHADLVICNSEVTRADAERHFEAAGRVPPALVAHLGVDLLPAADGPLPPEIDPARPWFLALGTIEPRKNHALILDIWDDFTRALPEDEIPTLVIAGRRGWRNEALFERLDTSPLVGRHIFELPDLDDAAVGALLAGARALLMPSLAEGFGLPPAEALALGTPAIVNDLPVYREVLGNNPVYANVADRYSWAETILDLARADSKNQRAAEGAGFALPTWQEHFNLVLKVT